MGDANVPTSQPTGLTNSPTSSPTEVNGSLGFPYCSESTCDGTDSPRADGTTNPTTYPTLVGGATYSPSKSPVTAAVTDEPSMSPVFVADNSSSPSIATLSVLLIVLIVTF